MKTLSKHIFSVPAQQPNEKPREWHLPRVAWLQSQLDDVPLLYHLGSLSEDCGQLVTNIENGKEALSPESKYLRKIRFVFWAAAMEGKVYLVQKRVAPPAKYRKPTFEYWSYPVPPK
tara:strand:- start:203 stop:553 length:351 start_codon:yes stop_codon:yes gene_type:complete